MIEAVLGHASALANRHASHILVAHCRLNTGDLIQYRSAMPAFARDTMVKQAQELANQQEKAVRDQFHALIAALGLAETDAPVPRTTSIEFVEAAETMVDVIKHHGRLADLVVVAKPDRDRNLGTNSLKSALFETGRPVLMCPTDQAVPTDLGRHITIAWNGSLEASRAVAMTLDLAKGADTVTILSGGKGEPHGATTEELVEYYRLRGISARAERFDTRNPAESLLALTSDLGADLLVMGAYGKNHERETLFGGNTQTVVDKAKIPVVLVH